MNPTTWNERDAVEAALGPSPVRRARIAASALYGILRDPDDTGQVFILALASARKELPRLLTEFVIDPEGLELLVDRPAIDRESTDYDALMRLAPHTLGGAYARFLRRHELTPDLFRAPEGLPLAVAYLSQRMRQTHDIWHVLTGYSTDVFGELGLQAFLYGNSLMPAPGLISVFGAFRFSIEDPRSLPLVWDGYRKGRRARFLPPIRWERRWDLPLDGVRHEFDITPVAPEGLGGEAMVEGTSAPLIRAA